jgi:hypothetical protein
METKEISFSQDKNGLVVGSGKMNTAALRAMLRMDSGGTEAAINIYKCGTGCN